MGDCPWELCETASEGEVDLLIDMESVPHPTVSVEGNSGNRVSRGGHPQEMFLGEGQLATAIGENGTIFSPIMSVKMEFTHRYL